MNKILLWIKNTLLLILFTIVLFVFFKYTNIFYLLLLLFILIVLSIIDIIKKRSILDDKLYNGISILCLLSIMLVLIKYFDSNISILFKYNLAFYDYYIPFIEQNKLYFIISLFGLIIYHFINNYKFNNKVNDYSFLSKICFILSILSIYPTLINLVITNKLIIYLLFTIIIFLIEIEELIRNNGKKKELIIYISFMFNMFAFISFFIK